MHRQEAGQLSELLGENQPLLTTYLMLDELKWLWIHRRPGWAGRHGSGG